MTDENIYYNFTYYNDTTTDQPAVINQTRTENILNDPSLYKLAVVRFNIPATNIPTQGNFLENYYFVRMKWDGAETTVYLSHIQNSDDNTNVIWNYQEFVDSINNALTTAYNNLLALKPLLPQTVPPFVYINIALEKLELFFETTYDSSIANNTEVIFNDHLYNRVIPISSFSLEEKKLFIIIVKDHKLNRQTIDGVNYYIMHQETDSLALMNDFQNILFESDRIPIEPELIASTNNITKRVLTDFESIETINDRSSLQYYPQGPLRFIDLNSHYPMRDTDLRVYWTSKNGKSNTLFIPPGATFTLKILFRKKNPDGSFNYT